MATIRNWKSRSESLAEEQKAETLRVNKLTIEERALKALDTNKAFLALTSPTNAQVVAQQKALTRQTSGIIRLLLNKLEEIE